MASTSTFPVVRYKLCASALLTPGHARTFAIEDTQVAVFRQRDGALFATQAQCPHAGGALADGVFGNGRVICPLHARKFELGTGQCKDSHDCLKTYPVYELDGHVVLEMDGAAQ